MHCARQQVTSKYFTSTHLAHALSRGGRGSVPAHCPAPPPPSQGDFIHSDHDNRDKFNAIFGPKLAACILQLIEQDAK